MNDGEILPPEPEKDPGERPPKGPSLTLLYSILALALAAAIGFALLIVFPFYKRR